MLVFPDTKGCSSPSAATPEGRIFGGARSQGSIYDDAGSAARYFNQFRDDGALYVYATKANKADRNGSRHPTIKGQMLMEWLVRLVTPRGGTVLDPFAGSGSTGLAVFRRANLTP
jgi:site-specific DNA-methyltransferase (adenine-specific)